MTKRLFQYIVFAMAAGVAFGAAVHANLSAESAASVAGYLRIITDIFLRLIKMIVAPLVLTTLIVGIAHMGDAKTLGRVGPRTIIWFLAASLFSLGLGLVMVNLLQPGAGFDLDVPSGGAAPSAEAFTLAGFITHLVPRSLFEAMTQNEILQIVIFSIFAGVALAALGEKTKRLVEIIEQGAFVMLRMTGYVMLLAPFAVFAAIGAVVATRGLGVILTYGAFGGGFYFSLILLWIALTVAGQPPQSSPESQATVARPVHFLDSIKRLGIAKVIAAATINDSAARVIAYMA